MTGLAFADRREVVKMRRAVRALADIVPPDRLAEAVELVTQVAEASARLGYHDEWFYIDVPGWMVRS